MAMVVNALRSGSAHEVCNKLSSSNGRRKRHLSRHREKKQRKAPVRVLSSRSSCLKENREKKALNLSAEELIVVTHEAHEPVTIGDLTFTFLSGGIQRVIEAAKQTAGDKKISLLGASIDQQCLKAGLVDEIVIHLVPIVLGEGIRLFDHVGSESIELERTEVVTTSQITSLRFRVTR